MGPLGKNKRNKSIKDTHDRHVPPQCLQAVPCLKRTKQKTAEKDQQIPSHLWVYPG